MEEEKKISNQQLGLLGENLVMANLLAHGWEAANLNISFGNFRNIDIYCQNKENQNVVIQVKTLYKNQSAFIGLTSKEAAETKDNCLIIGPWVFVKVKSLHPLDVEYYILSKNQMIELISSLHQWYLYQWERNATVKLEESPAAMQLWMLNGENRKSKYSQETYINPFKKEDFMNWDNIWKD